MNRQLVGCQVLSSFPGALLCASDSMDSDLRTWWGDAWSKVQADFLTLSLGRMYHHGAYRVLVWQTHTMLPVAISTDRSTDRPCALDMWHTSRSFTHQSVTCVIRRLAFLNLGFIEQMSCTPLPVTLYNLASQNSGFSTNLKILRK